MDSKEGIEKKPQPVNARVGALLDPSHQRSGPDDAGASTDMGADPLRVGSPASSSIPLDGIRKRESYCLFVRVLKDSEELLERDRLIPEHSWNAGICQDICESQSRVPPGSLAVELLSDSEFLLMKLPKTGRGITYDDSGMFQFCIEGSYFWGGPAPSLTLRGIPILRLGGIKSRLVIISVRRRRSSLPPRKPN